MNFKDKVLKTISNKRLLEDKNLNLTEKEKENVLNSVDISVMTDKFNLNVKDKFNNIEINNSTKEKALKSYKEIYQMFFKKYMNIAMDKTMKEKEETGKYSTKYLSSMMGEYNLFMQKFICSYYPDKSLTKEEISMPDVNKEYIENAIFSNFPKNQIAEAKKNATDNIIGKKGESHTLCDNLTNSFNSLKDSNTPENRQNFFIAYKLLQEKYHERNSFFYNWMPFRRGWSESSLLNNMRKEFMKLNNINSKSDFDKLLDQNTYAYDIAKKDFEKNVNLDKMISEIKKGDISAEQVMSLTESDKEKWMEETQKEHIDEIIPVISGQNTFINAQGTRFNVKGGKEVEIIDKFTDKQYTLAEFKFLFKKDVEELTNKYFEEKRLREEKIQKLYEKEENELEEGEEIDDNESVFTKIEDLTDNLELTPEQQLLQKEYEAELKKQVITEEFNKKVQDTIVKNKIVDKVKTDNYKILDDGQVVPIDDTYSEVNDGFEIDLETRQGYHDSKKEQYFNSVKKYNTELNNCYNYFKEMKLPINTENYQKLDELFDKLHARGLSENSYEGVIGLTKNDINEYKKLTDKVFDEVLNLPDPKKYEKKLNDLISISKTLDENINDLSKKQLKYKVSYYNKEDDVIDEEFQLETKEEYIQKHCNDEIVEEEENLDINKLPEQESEEKEIDLNDLDVEDLI